MDPVYIRSLYDYNAWANKRILDTATRLNPDQFLSKSGGSFDSIRDTLVHTMSSQWIWLSRWQGVSPNLMLNPAEFSDLETIRRRWAEIEDKTQTFIARLTRADLEQVIEYVNTKGQPFAYHLWQMIVHQVNHATQHRSEVAVILTHLGYSPGNLDFLVYLDQEIRPPLNPQGPADCRQAASQADSSVERGGGGGRAV